VSRGEREPWTVMCPHGVMLETNSVGWKWTFPYSSEIPFELGADDLASGLSAWKNDPESCREWASYLLADSSAVSFDELQKLPDGDAIIESLQDLAFGEKDAATKLHQLVARSGLAR
jgi:hypothetical protein